MSIQKNIELSPFTTFGVTCVADSLVRIQSVEELVSFMEGYDGSSENLLILGGGSNILFTRPFHGLVIKNEIRGIELIEENDEHYFVRVGAGEVWHDFVMHAIAQNWAGVENLSLIPGCAGAAPMQNIGAYGVEIRDVLTAVRAYHIPSKEVRTIAAEDCELAYRESIFKHKVKGEYVIVSIDLKLNKNPEFKTSYGAIQDELKRMGVTELNIRDISTAVINIRKSKLPDPQEIGNAGSFFKNPVVNPEKLAELQKAYPDIPHYPAPDGRVKLAAGWLIDQSGWKGKRFDDYGVHARQALVLVNYKNAPGRAIYDLSQRIIDDIKSRFGIELEREVNIL